MKNTAWSEGQRVENNRQRGNWQHKGSNINFSHTNTPKLELSYFLRVHKDFRWKFDSISAIFIVSI